MDKKDFVYIFLLKWKFSKSSFLQYNFDPIRKYQAMDKEKIRVHFPTEIEVFRIFF